MCVYIYIYIYFHRGPAIHRSGRRTAPCAETWKQPMSSKRSEPDPNRNSLIVFVCCKCIMESLICRCVLPYEGIILRIRVPLFASEPAHLPIVSLLRSSRDSCPRGSRYFSANHAYITITCINNYIYIYI